MPQFTRSTDAKSTVRPSGQTAITRLRIRPAGQAATGSQNPQPLANFLGANGASLAYAAFPTVWWQDLLSHLNLTCDLWMASGVSQLTLVSSNLQSTFPPGPNGTTLHQAGIGWIQFTWTAMPSGTSQDIEGANNLATVASLITQGMIQSCAAAPVAVGSAVSRYGRAAPGIAVNQTTCSFPTNPNLPVRIGQIIRGNANARDPYFTTAAARAAWIAANPGCQTPPPFVPDAVPASSTTPCTSPQIQCGSMCTSTQTDPNNCGSCGAVCSSGQVCTNGVCVAMATVAPCNSPNTMCGSNCTNTQGDAINCGTCGIVCPMGAGSCVNGVCVSSSKAVVPATVIQATCNGIVTNPQTDNNNCGICGNTCQYGQTCTNGSCGYFGFSPLTAGLIAVGAAAVLGGSIWYATTQIKPATKSVKSPTEVAKPKPNPRRRRRS